MLRLLVAASLVVLTGQVHAGSAPISPADAAAAGAPLVLLASGALDGE